MSLPIWTPTALTSARPYSGTPWRLVGAQHRVSTLHVVDTLAEQQLLEGSNPSYRQNAGRSTISCNAIPLRRRLSSRLAPDHPPLRPATGEAQVI